MNKAVTTALGAAIAVIVLPLFAAQSLSQSIVTAFEMSEGATGLVAMMPMLGYAVGLLLLVPTIDVFGIRRVILLTLFAGAGALAFAAVSRSESFLLVSVFVVGVATSATQMVVPLAANLARGTDLGRIIGKVMSGLMIGVLLSRPAASFFGGLVGWRGVFIVEGAAIGVVWIGFLCALSRQTPSSNLGYLTLLGSLWPILRDEKVLRRRVACQGLCMGAFGAFWTAIPLLLAAPPFELTQIEIAAFMFAGIGGAIVAPLAGWAVDRLWSERATRIAHALVVAGLVLAVAISSGWLGIDARTEPDVALAFLVLSAVVLDMGVIGDQTLGRLAVNSLRAEIRGRLNGLYTGLFFLGGGIGSALAGFAWSRGGWSWVCVLGTCFGVSAFLFGALTAPSTKKLQHAKA